MDLPTATDGRAVRDADPAPAMRGVPLLLAAARPHRAVLLLGVLLGLLGTAAALAQPLVAREVIEALGRDASPAAPVLLLSALVVASAVVTGVNQWLLERTGERIVLTARTGLVQRMLRLRVAEFDRRPVGDLLARVTSDTTLLRSVTTTALTDAVNGALTLVATLLLMAYLDLVLVAVTCAVLLTVVVMVALLLPRITRAVEAAQAAVGAMGGRLERALGAIRTVKAGGAVEREIGEVSTAAGTAYEAGVRAARFTAAAGVIAGLAIQGSFLAVLGVGGARVADGTLDVGTLVAFLLYLFYLIGPIASLTQGATQLGSGLAAVTRIREIDALAVEDDEPGAPAPSAPAPATDPLVRMEAVEFRYRDDRPPVLRGVDLAIPARGQTALVGPSGAGKTTIFSLLERFYDPDAGRILFGGQDITELPRDIVRAQIGYVEQDAPVLAGTLRDNLVLGATGNSDVDLRAVLVETRLDGLVSRLPAGLDTEVGSRGTMLSGGERQRVAIARALLRRPRLLLLDEVTAQLDAVNERALQAALERAAERCAVLVIAHRLSTVVRAAQIVVLDAGRVRAVGTHAELLERDDLYGELAATQLVATG
jgi:ABC-type multidrug transport system fused ATPase/permease subunit